MYRILDCTIRDGGHENNWNFDEGFIKNTVKNAIQYGAQYFEAGYRNYFEKEGKGKFYNCTPKLLQGFDKYRNSVKIGIMTDASRFCEKDFQGQRSDFADFVRIATHPQKIEYSLGIAEFLYSKGYKVFLQLMEIPNVTEENYKILKNWNNKKFLESLYIADSYSQVKPQDLEIYFDKLRQIGFEKISFHAHNGNDLALENTKKAIELGAFSVDVSQNGLGGNVNVYELLK